MWCVLVYGNGRNGGGSGFHDIIRRSVQEENAARDQKEQDTNKRQNIDKRRAFVFFFLIFINLGQQGGFGQNLGGCWGLFLCFGWRFADGFDWFDFRVGRDRSSNGRIG